MLQQSLQLAHQDTLSRNEQAFRIHEGNILAYQELASVLQLSLESLVVTDMATLSQSIGRFDASLVCSIFRFQGNHTKDNRNGSQADWL